ncbi:hypothetical protein SAMN04488490_2396 [Marinobacter sp. LV10R510-11A]|uniref:hypothetical protein n=1 Tax=Marinobacter sp. LV10R510-11A TaxID=1415568 RepID=UPI000BB73B0C|nr:hypothetical protein [Marinobacter sp. LV10R510-11A]SOB76686.1 hypothetical protein SAMN04488490_2396 [Marinobacter sp. LV10R510-11A]
MDNILYISQSPLQLINNIEAYLKLEKSHGKHLIFVRDDQSMEAIESIIDLFDLKNFIKYKINKSFKFLFPFILSTEARTNYQKIYFGNTTSYTSFLINKIKPRELIHVDDGTRTINLLQLDDNSNFFRKPILRFLNKSYLKKSTFFTYYSQQAKDSKKTCIENTLSETSHNISKLKNLKKMVPASQNQKIFIGTNILSSYENIEQIFDQLDTQVGLEDCIYLMHRYDDASLMSSLAQRYNFQAFKINLPIELYFLYLWKKNQPSVWTFGSTAIDTLTLISPETKFNIIKLNKDGFAKSTLGESFKHLYEHFEHNPMVTLHELTS